MKKQLLMTSILAVGMGFAQAQTSAPMQSGAPDASSRGSGAQTPAGNTAGTAGVASPTGTTDQAAAPQTFKGCLTGSTGSWSLAADNGQTLKLSGTDNQLSTYNNQQVNIQGTEATDGTLKVVSIDKISDSCNATGQAATSTGNTEQNTASGQSPATTSPSSQPPSSSSSSTGAMSNQSTTTSNTESTSTTSTGQTGAAAPSQSTTGATNTSPSTGTPPVSEQTPANTVGGSTADQGAAQNQPSGATGQSTTGQSATTGSQSATTGQTGNVPHISDMDQNQGAGQNAGQQKLPQTASPLPLLGLMGLGSIVAGLAGRRKK